MGKHVVAYLTWRDFLKEVETLRPETIRVQTYHQAEGKHSPVMVRFWAEASFVSQGEIHVARFPLGSTMDFRLQHEPHVRDMFASLMASAEQILRGALSPYGTTIRPGLYAETRKAKIQTSPEGLWRFERDGDSWRLVPELQEETAR